MKGKWLRRHLRANPPRGVKGIAQQPRLINKSSAFLKHLFPLNGDLLR
jgi:hypothetical protein